MLLPSIKATAKCMSICQQLYPGKHQGDGPENAFRHSLWNILLANEALKWNRNDKDKALQWALTLTTWHEDFAPNTPLRRAMDMHNNKVGRTLFATWQDKIPELKRSEIVDRLKALIPESRPIQTAEDVEKGENYLVHIEPSNDKQQI